MLLQPSSGWKDGKTTSGVVFLTAFQYLLENDKPWSFSITVSPRMTFSEVCSLGTVSTGHSGSCWAMDWIDSQGMKFHEHSRSLIETWPWVCWSLKWWFQQRDWCIRLGSACFWKGDHNSLKQRLKVRTNQQEDFLWPGRNHRCGFLSSWVDVNLSLGPWPATNSLFPLSCYTWFYIDFNFFKYSICFITLCVRVFCLHVRECIMSMLYVCGAQKRVGSPG